jgi:hypothetical protein
MNILPKNVKTSAPHCETSNLSNALFFFQGGGNFPCCFFYFFVSITLCILHDKALQFKCAIFPHILAVAQETRTKNLKSTTGEREA